jgi:hypothetical protein
MGIMMSGAHIITEAAQNLQNPLTCLGKLMAIIFVLIVALQNLTGHH